MESRRVVTKGLGEGGWGLLFNGDRASVLERMTVMVQLRKCA